MQMRMRFLGVGVVAVAMLGGRVAGGGPATRPAAEKGEGVAAVEGAIRDLTAEDYGVRERAAKRLEGLLARQIQERAAVQEVVGQLQAELERQVRALGMVKDEEARQRMGGLVEMEHGLAGWASQAMTAPAEVRGKLIEWGVSKEMAPVLGRIYGRNRGQQLAAIKELGKIEGPGADWTLARLMRERESWVRAAAMAAAWDRKPTEELVAAAWYRGVEGTEREREQAQLDETGQEPAPLVVEFPEHEPIILDMPEEDFSDRDLAVSVLVHMQSPLVEARLKALVAKQAKQENSSLEDSWEHRLLEAYKVREAVPFLARVALGEVRENSSRNVGASTMEGTNRTSAAGAVAVIVGIDPADFELHADKEEMIGWWVEGQHGDTAAVMKFFDWWRVHYKEYGVKQPPAAPAAGDEPLDEADPLELREFGPPEPAELERQHEQQENGRGVNNGRMRGRVFIH
jgi:hypothetical protein